MGLGVGEAGLTGPSEIFVTVKLIMCFVSVLVQIEAIEMEKLLFALSGEEDLYGKYVSFVKKA